jgi:hypothetical protein
MGGVKEKLHPTDLPRNYINRGAGFAVHKMENIRSIILGCNAT